MPITTEDQIAADLNAQLTVYAEKLLSHGTAGAGLSLEALHIIDQLSRLRRRASGIRWTSRDLDIEVQDGDLC